MFIINENEEKEIFCSLALYTPMWSFLVSAKNEPGVHYFMGSTNVVTKFLRALSECCTERIAFNVLNYYFLCDNGLTWC